MSNYTAIGWGLGSVSFLVLLCAFIIHSTSGKEKRKLKKRGGSATKKTKYSHIDFKPTKGMIAAAKRGIKLRKKYGRGGLTTTRAGKLGIGSGYQRAVDIVEGQSLSPKTVRMMKSFFARHSANKKYHDKSPPSNALISWLLWGGDPGESWSNKIVKQMNKADS